MYTSDVMVTEPQVSGCLIARLGEFIGLEKVEVVNGSHWPLKLERNRRHLEKQMDNLAGPDLEFVFL